MTDLRQLEAAIWSIADGRATDDVLTQFHADERASVVLLDRLIGDVEDDIDSVKTLRGDERDQVLADFNETLDSLLATMTRIRQPEPSRHRLPEPGNTDFDDLVSSPTEDLQPGEVQLQASWHAGLVVVWAAGRGTAAEDNDALATRLEKIDGPPLGWHVHAGFMLPGGHRAEALAISMKDALGWLAHVGGGLGASDVGPSVAWLARVAVEGVRMATRGAIVPRLRAVKRADVRHVDLNLNWSPALLDTAMLDALSASMPGTVIALGGPDSRATTIAVLTAVVEAIVVETVGRMELPAQPPSANTPIDIDDSLIARLDGRPFTAPFVHGSDLARRFEQWSGAVTASKRQRLVVELAAPDPGGVWLISVFASPS